MRHALIRSMGLHDLHGGISKTFGIKIVIRRGCVKCKNHIADLTVKVVTREHMSLVHRLR